jgi:hypothetical protein
MRRSGVEMPLHLVKEFRKFLQGDLGLEQVKHLYKATHMGALVFVGQIDVHIDGCHRVLATFAPVPHGDRIAEVFNPHFIDGNIAVVTLVLNVFHWSAGRLSETGYLFEQVLRLHVPHGSEDIAFDLTITVIELLQQLFYFGPLALSRAGAWILAHGPLHLL